MKNIVEFLKLPIQIITALFVATTLLLFMPDKLAQKIFVEDFRLEYGSYIGIIFVITLSLITCYLLFYFIPKILGKIIKKIDNKKLKYGQQKLINSLNKNELEIIKELIKQPDNTMELPMNRGIVQKLEYNFIISKAGSTFAVDITDPIIPYFLQPWVFEFFDSKGNLIKDNDNIK